MNDGGENGPARGAEDDQEEVGSLATEASRGMMWTSLSSLGARGLGFMTTIILTYWISQDQYGKANAAYEIALTLGFFCIPGLESELIRRKERFGQAATLTTIICILPMLLCVGACMALAEPVAVWFDSDPLMLRTSMLIPAFMVAFVVGHAMLTKQMRFGTQSVIELGGSMSNVGVAVSLALTLSQGTRGLAVVLGQCMREIVVRVLGAVFTGFGWVKRPRYDRKLLREMLGFGIPVYISEVLEHVATHWDNLFVARVFGDKALGRYAVAYTIAYTPIYTVAQRSAGVVLAAVAQFAEDPERRRDALIRALGAILLVLMPTAVMIGLSGPRVVAILFPSKWTSDLTGLVAALSLVGIGLPLQYLPDYYFQAIGKPRATMAVMGMTVALMFLALHLFGRGFSFSLGSWGTFGVQGVEASAWAVSISFIVAGLGACCLLWLVDDISPGRILRQLVPCTVGTVLVVATVFALRHLLGPPTDNLAAPVIGENDRNLLLLVLECVGAVAVYLVYQMAFHRERLKDIINSLLGRGDDDDDDGEGDGDGEDPRE